jgi:uncharacterized membrane protein
MNELARVCVVGAVSGSRSMLGLALIANRVLPPAASAVIGLLASGEMAADKSPGIGSRTDPLPLAGRIVTGALAASALASRGNRLPAAATGAAAALVATFALYHLRRTITTRLGVEDAAVGLAEDALAVTAGWLASKGHSS